MLDDFEFRKATGVKVVPSNTLLNIGVAPGNSTGVSDTLRNFPFTLEDGKHYVLIATGEVLGNGNKALKIYSFDQGRIDAAAGGTASPRRCRCGRDDAAQRSDRRDRLYRRHLRQRPAERAAARLLDH